MTPARLIPIVFLYLFSGASIACTFRDTRNNAVYELNLSEAECRTISYIDGPIIPMRLSYPEGKVVDSAWRGGDHSPPSIPCRLDASVRSHA